MGWRSVLALVWLMPACGRFGFDELLGTTDASSTMDANGPRDPDAAAAFCASQLFTMPAASSFTDDFSVGMLTDRWTPISTCITQTGSEIIAAPADNLNQYCHAWQNAVVHLTCDRLMVRVAEITSSAINGPQTFIYLNPVNLQPPEFISAIAENGGFTFGKGATNWTVTGPGYDPVQDAWWQLRETGGELVFETSPDASNWLERSRVPTPVALEEVQIAIGAGTWLPVTGPGRGRFHCYNRPPPCN